VLDITCAAADDNDLLKPFVTRGACDIEERLLETGIERPGCTEHSSACGGSTDVRTPSVKVKNRSKECCCNRNVCIGG